MFRWWAERDDEGGLTAGKPAEPEKSWSDLTAGQAEEGAALLEKSAKASDPLIQYLSLMALRENSTK